MTVQADLWVRAEGNVCQFISLLSKQEGPGSKRVRPRLEAALGQLAAHRQALQDLLKEFRHCMGEALAIADSHVRIKLPSSEPIYQEIDLISY